VFRPVSLFVGLRYTRAKRRNHFISFISLTSMIGIALGVTVLITVLSVMNGFDAAIRDHFFAMAQQVNVRSLGNSIPAWETLAQKLSKENGVTGAAPFVEGQGLISANGQTSGVMTFGILPDSEKQISILANKMVSGSLDALTPRHFGIVLGAKLAGNLGLSLGDKVTLIVPTATLTPVGILPRYKIFTVAGIFKIGNGFGYDSQYAYMNLQDAQKLFLLGNAVSGIQLKLKDFYQAPALSKQLADKLPPGYLVSNWTENYGAFFEAIKLEKTMMFLMLILIIAVAAFNLVSTLVMMVTDKRADIAILRTLGATPQLILRIFMIQGIVIGVVGTMLGLAGGILLSLHVTELVNSIQTMFHLKLISSDVYYVNYLPSRLQPADVWHVCLISLGLSLLATIYPALKAAGTQPAEALRYE
jgi:lipoprotein-releasing system permease protein